MAAADASPTGTTSSAAPAADVELDKPTEEATAAPAAVAPEGPTDEATAAASADDAVAPEGPTDEAAAAPAEDAAAPEGAAEKESSWGRRLAWALAGCRVALVVVCATLAALAALLTSKTVGVILTLTPLADDKWGLKAIAAALRVGSLAMSLVRAEPPSLVEGLACAAHLLTFAAVELAALFAQPIFGTFSGGGFKSGDATKAAILRVSRTSWLSIETLHPSALLSRDSVSGLALLGVCMCVWRLDKAKRPRKGLFFGAPRVLVSIAGKGARAVVLAVLLNRTKTLVLEALTNLPLSSYLAALPDELYMSRHEFSLFRWSIDSSTHLALILIGDVLSANPAAHPLYGLSGTLALGAGLALAAIPTIPFFKVQILVWSLHAMCHVAFARLGPPKQHYVLTSPLGQIECKPGANEPSAAKILVRVGGWRTPIYKGLDQVVAWSLVGGALLAKPSWTWRAIELAGSGGARVARVCWRLVFDP